MIKFTPNIDEALPYNREQVTFLNEDADGSVKWYGISFQLPGGYEGRDIPLEEFVTHFEGLFNDVISQVDNGAAWIVSQQYAAVGWFPYNNNTLPRLRALFKENLIQDTFSGALICKKNELLAYAEELITYPYAVTGKEKSFYVDLNISHAALQFVIKISAHLNIDFWSTDLDLLKQVVKENATDSFVLIPYNGTPDDL